MPFVLQIDKPLGAQKWGYLLSNIHSTPDDNVLGVGQCGSYEDAYNHAKGHVEKFGGELVDPQDVVEFFSRFWEQMPPA